MEKTYDKIWSNCLSIIKDIVEWQHFKTWFEPIQPVALKGSVLTIQVPSQFFYEYIEEHYVTLLSKTLKREMGKDARLEYRIMVDSGNDKNKPMTMDVSGQAFKSYSNNDVDFPLVISNQVKNPFVIPGLKKMQIDSQLNPIYTLDAFVEGDCNRVARRAGKTVAEKPGGTSFNPLVVYGGVGIGGSLYVASATAISGVTINNGVITGNLTGTASTATYAHQSGYGITAGFATTANYSNLSGLATTATYSHQSGYAVTSGNASFV
jgi:chromosomal replication initiation ATPase DnaA